jgi:hypothetical protein
MPSSPLSRTLRYTGAKFCAYMAETVVNTSDHYADFAMDSERFDARLCDMWNLALRF